MRETQLITPNWPKTETRSHSVTSRGILPMKMECLSMRFGEFEPGLSGGGLQAHCIEKSDL
jgi:hypothetical protein